MAKITYELTEEAKLHLQRIQNHMEKLRAQRLLVAKLEHEGKETAMERQTLKVMLANLEAMLALQQQLTRGKSGAF
jgi:hypothetical protein